MKRKCKGCGIDFVQNQKGRIYVSKKTGKYEKRSWFHNEECFEKYLRKILK